jgi:hypothetical protein
MLTTIRQGLLSRNERKVPSLVYAYAFVATATIEVMNYQIRPHYVSLKEQLHLLINSQQFNIEENARVKSGNDLPIRSKFLRFWSVRVTKSSFIRSRSLRSCPWVTINRTLKLNASSQWKIKRFIEMTMECSRVSDAIPTSTRNLTGLVNGCNEASFTR